MLIGVVTCLPGETTCNPSSPTVLSLAPHCMGRCSITCQRAVIESLRRILSGRIFLSRLTHCVPVGASLSLINPKANMNATTLLRSNVQQIPIPLSAETRTALDTATAAFHVGRKPQTLRKWACNESGPIRPIRVNGRLAWQVADLKKLLGVA